MRKIALVILIFFTIIIFNTILIKPPPRIKYANLTQYLLSYIDIEKHGQISESAKVIAVNESESEPEPKTDHTLDAYGNKIDLDNTWGHASWEGSKIDKTLGVNNGPSGFETYYNLPMTGIFRWFGDELAPYTIEDMWISEYGIKMLGPYVMVASDLENRPRGSLVNTSVGMGIVVDYNGHIDISGTWTDLDIAVTW